MPVQPRTDRVLIDRMLVPPTRRQDAELLDAASHDPVELEDNFRDIRRVNRWLGGTAAVLRHLPPLIDATPATRPVMLLDLATGAADIPLAIATWAAQRQRSVMIVASDASDAVLGVAQAQVAACPAVSLSAFDARAVPLPDRSFDIVLCSLSLHHFGAADAVRILAEMQRLARVGCIVNDLARSWPGYAGAWLAARLTTRNRLTRHDAPLSVLRAYTPDELRELLRTAGIDDARVLTHPWFRMVATWRTDGDGHGR